MERRTFIQLAAAAPLAPWIPGKAASATYISDLSCCMPGSALSREPNRHHWRLLPYETAQFNGTMLVAGQNTAAPEVRIPISQTGWHAVYFGLRSYGAPEDTTRILVRLDSDNTFSMISHTEGKSNRIDDYFWKAADLKGEPIVLRQFQLRTVPENPESAGNACQGVWLAYVKLVPLSESEVREMQEERRSGKHRRLFAHHDAWSFTFTFRPTEAADIRREIEPFRDTDFSRIYWEAGMGDRMYYPSKIALTAADDWIRDPYRVGDRLAGETWRIWREKGIDPFRVALDHAHAIGLEFHATYRPAGFHFPVPEDEWNRNGFYDKHPELRGVDRNGRTTPRLSYAYPEVRRKAVDLIAEMAQYPIDGVCIAYNRRPPLVEYEPPVVDSFRKQYGEDPRKLDDKNPRWLRHRAGALTEFMREVRTELKEQAQRQKRRPYELTAIVMGSEQENLFYAMDLEAWIRAGLVDTIMPYTSVSKLLSSADSFVNPRDAEFFLRIARGTSVKVAPNLMPRVQPPDSFRTRANGLYQAGAEYLFFWDTNARNDFSPSWSALRRLGHREELAEWARKNSPAFERPGTDLRKLGDWDLSYATPG